MMQNLLTLYIQMPGSMEPRAAQERLIFGPTVEKHCNQDVQSATIKCSAIMTYRVTDEVGGFGPRAFRIVFPFDSMQWPPKAGMNLNRTK